MSKWQTSTVKSSAPTEDKESAHPLEHTWVMWYDHRKTVTPGKWEDCLVQISEFATVEEFWGTFNHIKRPSTLEFGANYHMFKQGVKPAWEDPANIQGGKWVITLASKDELMRLDKAWEHLLLSLIGEYVYDGIEGAFPASEAAITGVVVSRRRANTRIAVWTADRTQEAMLLALGRRLKEVMQCGDTGMEYQPHNAEADGAATTRPPMRL